MLFISESVMEAKRQIMHRKTDNEEAFRRVLELDANDHMALIGLGQIRQIAGNDAEAEAFYWRALQTQPCAYRPYIYLSSLLAKHEEVLSVGLAELAIRKLLLSADAESEIEDEDSPFFLMAKTFKAPKGLNARQKLEMAADQLGETRESEPAAVTARLRSLRLIHQLQEGDPLTKEEIDGLIDQGEATVPLLIGVLRGWAQNVLEDDDTLIVESSLAILGEIGDVSAIPSLLELVEMEDPEISGPGEWALDRIAEKNPSASAKLFKELAPTLDGRKRVAIAHRVMKYPAIESSKEMLASLFENLDRLDAEDRDVCFPTLLLSGVMLLGREGLEFARSVLRRQGALLSRKVRRDCDELMEEFSTIRIPPRPTPEPSKWNVYDICHEMVDWVAEEEEDEEDDDEDFAPPEPVRRKSLPGRNDPCWCGSGKKYKKCHLDSDEAAKDDEVGIIRKEAPRSSGELDDLRVRIGDFMMQAMGKRETSRAVFEFLGKEQIDDPTEPMALFDWIIHDRIFKGFGRPVMEEYLKRNGASLSDREREFVESSARSYMDLYEVQEVKEGRGIEVKSLTSGETMFLHDVNTSKVAVRWDGLFARLVSGERGIEMTGSGVRVVRMHLDSVRQWLEEDRKRSGLAWPVYLKQNWPRIYAQNTRVAENWMDSLHLKNSDGDEIAEAKAFYNVLDREALLAALRSREKIHEDEEGRSFVWLSAEEKGTVLGSVRLEDGRLTLDCNSKERLARGKRLLADLAGSAVRFEGDELVSQAEMIRSIKDAPPRAKSQKSEIPREVKERVEREYMEDYYAKWLDTKLPVLGGKTPRQAVKNAAGKRKVAEILKQIENMEAHKRKEGGYAFDVSILRAELGVKG